MVLVFFSKQSEHLESLLALTESHPSRDTALVARSMLEGLAQLLWAHQQPEERAKRWKAYAFVADWRLLRQKDEAGERTDPHTRNFIQEGLQRYGDLFLTKKAKRAKQAGQPLPFDPYHDAWTGKTGAALIEKRWVSDSMTSLTGISWTGITGTTMAFSPHCPDWTMAWPTSRHSPKRQRRPWL